MTSMRAAQFELFDGVSAVVVVLDRHGRIAHWNRAASKLTGYDFDEVRGRYVWDVVLRREDVAEVRAVFAELTENSRPSSFENYWVTKRGEWRWLAWASTVTTDAEGQVEYVIATGVDRTGARTADERRRVSEAKLEAIISIAADAIISIDERQRIVLFNRGAEEIFGYTAEEVRGEPLSLLIPERFAHAHEARVNAFRCDDDSARQMAERAPDIVGIRKGGDEFPAEAAISKVVVEGAWLFTVILRDISDRKLVERSLREAITARDHLLGTVAHDLRNPLSSIGLQATLLARAAASKSETPHPAISRIDDESKRMMRLIDDLLDYTRIESGELLLSRVELALRELVATAVGSARALAHALGLEIEVDVPKDIGLVRVDPDRIRQVFDNLLGNAMKFSFEGGVVRVVARAHKAGVSVSVIDQGAGIPTGDQGRLFEPFWQADRRDRRGAGLGLTICKQIVEAHGGTIDVTSPSGGGSCFTFTLPR